MAELGKIGGVGAPALGFAILTSAPSGEVQGLRWREVDMAAAVRAVPAGRMKMRERHLVPLPTPCWPPAGLNHVTVPLWCSLAARRTLNCLP